MAGRQGVEPRLSGSEPLVLPLNDLPARGHSAEGSAAFGPLRTVRGARVFYGFTGVAQGRNGWGGRIRTSEWRLQRPLPYHLATPQDSSPSTGRKWPKISSSV